MTDLLGIPPTHLPDDPASHALEMGVAPDQVAAANPTSSLAWAVLAEDAFADGQVIESYAYARTGYHRGLDALRARAGAARARCRGSTSRTAGSCAPSRPCRGRPRPSARRRSATGAPSSCAPRVPPAPESWGSDALTPDPAASDGGLLLVLEEQLRREHERIEARRADLATTRDLLSRVTSRALGARARAVEVIEDAHAPSVVSALLADTTGLLRNYVLTVAEGPALDAATMQANVDRIRRGSPQRALYPATVLDAADGGRWMAQWAEVGEEQRVLPTTETEFAVFGSTAVVALAAWDDPSRGYAIIRDPLVIRLYSAYFALGWASAGPVATLSGGGGVGGVGGAGDAPLVELLELGLKDEAIARHLGVSLRTVRRHIAALMEVNGVDTRFQLGAALARQQRGVSR